jgi:hypothetical protein
MQNKIVLHFQEVSLCRMDVMTNEYVYFLLTRILYNACGDNCKNTVVYPAFGYYTLFVCTDLITLKETWHEIFNFRFFHKSVNDPKDK